MANFFRRIAGFLSGADAADDGAGGELLRAIDESTIAEADVAMLGSQRRADERIQMMQERAERRMRSAEERLRRSQERSRESRERIERRTQRIQDRMKASSPEIPNLLQGMYDASDQFNAIVQAMAETQAQAAQTVSEIQAAQAQAQPALTSDAQVETTVGITFARADHVHHVHSHYPKATIEQLMDVLANALVAQHQLHEKAGEIAAADQWVTALEALGILRSSIQKANDAVSVKATDANDAKGKR